MAGTGTTTATAKKNGKGVNVNKLSEKQQAFVKECIAKNPWMEERIKGGHLIHTFKFRYDNGTVEKTVFIPERWGMSQEFEPVTDEDYIIPNPNGTTKDNSEEAEDSKEKKSSDKKEEKGEEKKPGFWETEIKRGFAKALIAAVFSLILILGFLAITGGSFFNKRAYVTGRVNTMNTGYIDMDCDGIPDENWDQNDFGLRTHNQIMYIQELQRTWND